MTCQFSPLQSLMATLLWLPATVLAVTEPSANNAHPNIHFSQGKVPGAELQLDVKQATLTDVIAHISAKTNVVIHYSVLPEAPVSATCIAGKVQQLMECLVGKQIGVLAHKGDSGKDEVWLLGSSVGGCPAVTAQQLQTQPKPPLAKDKVSTEPTQADLERSSMLLEQAKAKDPSTRADAIANLASGGLADDPEVRKTLEVALTDKNAAVRIQALSSLALREGDQATAYITQALKDSDASVRLMAVNSAGNDTVLLQKAMNDSDKMIRDYAAEKLNALQAQQN